jgi:hypothetical protein
MIIGSCVKVHKTNYVHSAINPESDERDIGQALYQIHRNMRGQVPAIELEFVESVVLPH